MRISDSSSDVCSSDLSNARVYRFGFDDGRRFHQIASDGGLLPQPHPTSSIELAPAERAEIIVDVSDGRPVRLRASSAERGMMGGGGMMRSGDRKSVVSGKSVSVRVDLGVRRLIKKKTA